MTLEEAEAFAANERAQYGHLYQGANLRDYPKIVPRN
jgi:hypothetical protein